MTYKEKINPDAFYSVRKMCQQRMLEPYFSYSSPMSYHTLIKREKETKNFLKAYMAYHDSGRPTYRIQGKNIIALLNALENGYQIN